MEIVKARIMVVDDDAVMRKHVVDSLFKIGVQAVRECSDGTDALKFMASFWPDVVLTDIYMEPMGGFDFVRKLREHLTVEFRKSRVIFMSADTDITTLEDAQLLGALGYIVKPPTLEILQTKLEWALSKKNNIAWHHAPH